MITQDQVRDLIGCQIVDTSGEKIGKVGQIFLDDQTGKPEWATVNTGFFGSGESFVPLAEADADNGEIRVPYDKAKVKDAPNVDADGGHLDQNEESELYRYYGLDYSEQSSDSGLAQGTTDRAGGTTGRSDTDMTTDTTTDMTTDTTTGRGTVGRETSGKTDDAMTRSEERLHVGTETQETGKARLRKWVETDQETVTVPVKKEKARLVSEPITDANRGDAVDGPDLSEEEHEVTLSEERVSVNKETVPVERVRLEKDVEVEDKQVSEDVRKERIDTDGDLDMTESERSRSNR